MVIGILTADQWLKIAEISVAGVIAGLALWQAWRAIGQWKKSQAWKAAEFVACEMKALFADPRVSDAMKMIDWWERKYEFSGDESVTSMAVARALRHHTVKNSDGKLRFTPVEMGIRDRMDALLDGLQRFSTYEESKLVRVEDLEPYLRYWAEGVLSYSPQDKSPEDVRAGSVALRYRLLSYAQAYGYERAVSLLLKFTHSDGAGSISKAVGACEQFLKNAGYDLETLQKATLDK